MLIALGVVLVSVVPQIFGIFTRLLGLEDRGFALLSIAVLLLFGLFLNLLGRVREAGRRSGEIVTGLAVREYSERYLSSEERAEGHPGEILIIVPAYDEEGGIQEVLRRIPDEVLGHEVKTVVVDDGSADRTADIARDEGVPVVTPRGQPRAGRRPEDGLRDSAGREGRGRRQPRRRRPVQAGGARPARQAHNRRARRTSCSAPAFMGYYQEAGSVRHVGVVFFSRLISLLTGVKVSDCTNGYRAIRVSELHKLNLREDRFNANEIILEGLKNKLRFEQVPVSMLSRAAGETKKPPKLAYPLGVFRVIISTWLR